MEASFTFFDRNHFHDMAGKSEAVKVSRIGKLSFCIFVFSNDLSSLEHSAKLGPNIKRILAYV